MSDAVRRLQLTSSESLQVEGQNDLLVYRARCCNPIRGEEIVGYVTRGKGVAVHARSCPNVQNLLYESDRRINVEWSRTPDAAGKPQRYPVKITIFCDDRTGMLKELTAVISDENADIRGVDLRATMTVAKPSSSSSSKRSMCATSIAWCCPAPCRRRARCTATQKMLRG
jgi:guanosine-3',5'-bis(diphosphate) 3'-pyrophosphohydrolase